MKLYHVNMNSIIEVEGIRLYFYHIDGMYSYCKTMTGEVTHIAAWSDVEVVGEFNPKELTFKKKRQKTTS